MEVLDTSDDISVAQSLQPHVKLIDDITDKIMRKLARKIRNKWAKKQKDEVEPKDMPKKKFKKQMDKVLQKKYNTTYKAVKAIEKELKPPENTWKFENNQAMLKIDGKWVWPLTPKHKVDANRQYKAYLREIIQKGYVPDEYDERLLNWTAKNVKVDYEADPEYWNEFVLLLAVTKPDVAYWFLEFGYKDEKSLRDLGKRYPEFKENHKYAKHIAKCLNRAGAWDDIRFKQLQPKDRLAYMKTIYAHDKKSEFRAPDKSKPQEEQLGSQDNPVTLNIKGLSDGD